MRRFSLPAWMRRRWLAGLAGGVVVLPLCILAWMYWWLLPNLPAYKDEVADLLSSATGYAITLDKIEGEWGGARPRFQLEGVQVSRGGRPLLYFSRLDGRFGWRTLLALEPRFHELTIEAPALTVRRASDGVLHVGGIRVDPNSTDTSFSDWLLKQGEVNVRGATVAWIDETLDGRPLVLRNVSLRLQNLLTRHAFRADFSPPAWLSKPMTFEGVMHGRSLSRREEWRGTAKLDIPALELAAWQAWLPPAYAQVRGHGSVVAALGVQDGQLSGADLKLNLAGLNMQLPQFQAPLALARVAGEAGWLRETRGNASSSTMYARKLSLRDHAGTAVAPFDFSWRWGTGEQAMAAENLHLDQMAALAQGLPLTQEQKAQLRALQPHGVINSLKANWPAVQGGGFSLPEAFRIDLHFTDLGWTADGARPGAARLSGMLAGSEQKGTYLVSGNQAGFDLPAIFADPAIRFDSMNIRGGWKRQQEKGGKSRVAIEIAEALLSNADLTASVYGRYLLDANGPGHADLNGRVERASGARVQRYLPLAINQNTHDWLRKGILRGEVKQASFKLQGDLAKFPFKTARDGIFRVNAPVYGAQVHYAEGYPKIDDIDGELLMDGLRLEVRSDKARIFGAQLRKVRVGIPDLNTVEEVLEVKGEAQGPASEFIRFVNFSPVSERIEGLTEEMTASGDMHLQLSLKVPLRHTDDTTIAGRLSFLNDTIYPAPSLPRLEQVNGQLDFTDQSISAPKLTARILGGPASISAATEGGQARVRGSGVLQAAALESWLGSDVSSRLAGQTEWKGDLSLGGGANKLRFESSLAGLSSRLPSPLQKPASRPSQLVFEQRSSNGGAKWSSLQYGNIASAVWTSHQTPGGFKLERGELRFGGEARLPAEPGLQIAGYVNSFDLGGWVDILPEDQSEQRPVNISGINLTLASLDFLKRKFHDISINAKLRGNLLRAAVAAKEFSGSLTYRRSGEGPSRLSVQLKNFTIPEAVPASPVPVEDGQVNQLEAASFPAFDLQVEDLKLGEQPLGRLEVIAHGVPSGMAIDQLNLIHADSVIRMSGVWKDTGMGETRVKVNGDIKNAGQMLERFGYAGAIRRGSASIDGDVAWLGSPADFTFKTLDGTLRLHAKSGQFLKVNPGAGKLLGIASLQSLRRRITLDFRDVFSEGFAFDEISSTMQLARGELYTNDFLMKGPAATVKMSGVASLQKETVKLRVKVMPKLSEGVAVAGALLGGPAAGLGALVVQKVLKDPIEEAISFEYLVDGGWESPVVTRLAKPKTEPKTEQEPES